MGLARDFRAVTSLHYGRLAHAMPVPMLGSLEARRESLASGKVLQHALPTLLPLPSTTTIIPRLYQRRDTKIPSDESYDEHECAIVAK